MTNEPKCAPECTIIHQDIIDSVASDMPPEEVLFDLAEIFKIFGDLTRVKILWALSSAEMCGCDIAALLNTSTSAVSHQLRILRSAKLAKPRKEGKVVYYSLCDDHVRQLFQNGLAHVME